MNVPVRVIGPKPNIPGLKEHGQSNGSGDDTGQELAGSKTKSSTSVTLSGSSTRWTRRTRGGRPRALGGSGRNGRRNAGRGSAGTWAGTRASNREGASTVDLLLFLGGECSRHAGQLELGGECQRGILRLLGILQADRLESDEAEWGAKKVGSDLPIRSYGNGQFGARTTGQSSVQWWGRG